MSDFLVNVLNRHMGIGQRVRPRIRTRFEPDASVYPLPKCALYMAEVETENRGDKQEGFHYTKPAAISPTDKPSTNTISDSNSQKHQVHNQDVQITSLTETIRQETEQQIQNKSNPEPDARTVYVVPPDVNKDMGRRRAVTSTHTKPDSLRQKSVQRQTNVSHQVSAVDKYDMGKSLRKHSHLVKTEDADNPIHKSTISGHRGSQNPQSGQHRSTTSNFLPALSGSRTKPEHGMMKLQPGAISVQNADIRSQGLLQIPAWLSEGQSELHNGLFMKDSRVETKPVANVTIGRIEVRAAPRKIEQSERMKKPSGVMSLDKYLSQRTQGGNR